MAGLYNHVGLNISNDKLQLVEILSDPTQIRLDNLAEVIFAEPINFKTDRSTKILAQLQSAYDEIRLKRPTRSKTFSFALPLELFYVVQLPYDNTLMHQDLLSELHWEYSVLFPHKNREDFVLIYQQIEKNMFIKNNTVLIYGLERKYIKLLQSFCGQNNLTLGFIDNMHLAAERALKTSDTFSTSGLALSVYLTKNHFSIIFMLNGKLIYQSIHKMQGPEEAGKLIKRQMENNKLLQARKGLVQASYVTGDFLLDDYIGKLNFYSGLNFVKYNPFDKLVPNPKLKDSPLLTKSFNSFSSAAGIAFRIA